MRRDPAEVRLDEFRRIAVCGPSGAGKTHLALQIAERLHIPYFDMDALNFEPGWVETQLDIVEPRLRALVEQDAWVTDGNYGKWRHITVPRVQLAIWLDYPLPFTFQRLLRRTIARCRSGEEIWPGCRESWRISFFGSQSILIWLLGSYRRRRRQLAQFGSDPSWSHVTLIAFRQPEELEQWFAST